MADTYNIASARAYSNIAFIKYWGNRDHLLRLPANSSLSMNLSALHTTTTVRWLADMAVDSLTINGEAPTVAALRRVQAHLDMLRRRLGTTLRAQVDSRNNFPMGAGIASSASAFAALTMAAVAALHQQLSERELSALARLGSGSAARSIPGGFVEWRFANTHEDSTAETIAPADHWHLVDVIAIVSHQHKRVGSTAGHASASSSIFQSARVETAAARLKEVKQSIAQRDFELLAQVVEADSNLMHAVMMTSRPPLFYWQPLTLAVMEAVRGWREDEGLRVCYTLDAGPNVHCICAADDAQTVADRLSDLSPDIDILRSGVGGGAVLLPPVVRGRAACTK
ncbi:MAG: diphosphomevalonate decarboxylase [Chloroflexi bacterium]|nr:diphosphomevalonate decarboxylase [Chloroflexota bacterium]